MATTAITSYATLPAAGAKSGTTAAADDEGSADRFLKLLVAQMQNQDPLNPLDNAQVTSQMAQINTVNGIEKLNTTVQGLNSQFVQLQALQGAALVGREVTVPGNRLSIAQGQGAGAFELAQPADSVKLEVLNSAGRVIDSVDFGTLNAGRHRFDWPAGTHGDDEGLRFRIAAKRGAADVSHTLLMQDRVQAVSASGNTLTLELRRAGLVPYSEVKTFDGD